MPCPPSALAALLAGLRWGSDEPWVCYFGQDEADVSVAMMHSDVRKASNLYKMQGAELDDTGGGFHVRLVRLRSARTSHDD
eukprot:3092406-Prorocentrum_lima.AAC.1